MVYYGRRRRFKRRYRRKPRGGGFLGSAAKAVAIAGTALSVARGVKAMLNVEYKNYDNAAALNPRNIVEGGQVLYLHPIVQGETANDRNGSSIKVTQMYINSYILHNSDGDDVQGCRIMVIQDKAQDGQNEPNYADGDRNSIMTDLDINAMKNLSTTNRYKILHDKKYFVSSERPVAQVKIFQKLNDRVEFNSDLGTNVDAGFNSLWLVLIGSQATDNYPIMHGQWRVRYIDN